MRLRVLLVTMLTLTTVLLAACPGPTPTPLPLPTQPPPPTLPAPPTVAAPSPAPDDFRVHETARLVIRLPKNWEALDVEKSDLQAVFAEFQKNNPQLAAVVGSADALRGVALWAFSRPAGDGTGFVDNLNIRRVSLAGQPAPSIQALLDQVLGQYRQLGFVIGESKADLKIGAQPAAIISYIFPMVGADGKTISADGRQYLVLTTSDLWILSYTLGPGQAALLAPMVEESAQSFRVK
jgi:hypothetical protein